MRSKKQQPKRQGLEFADFGYSTTGKAPLTPQQVREKFGPAHSLGAPEEARLAMDSALEASGAYSLIQHAFQMGQAPLPEFVGYGVLQSLAQNGLIRACIETVADDMTRAWIKLSRDKTREDTPKRADPEHGGDLEAILPPESVGNGPGSPEVEKDDRDTLLADMQAEMERLHLQDLFHEAVELVGYEGGAMIFIDTGATGDDLLTPLNLSEKSGELRKGGLKRFTVVDPVNVFPGDYNSTDPLQPDYFRPKTWWVLGQRVHSSRLLRLVANECPVLLRPSYNFFGIPQAQILWDYVLHFQECRIAEMRLLKKFSLTIFKTQMSDILYSAAGTASLDRRMRLFVQSRDNDGVPVIDKNNEDIVNITTPIGGVTDIVRQALELLAALNRTPAVKLLGISPSGFNATGESDLRNYYDHIKSQQEKVMRKALGTCLKVIQLNLTGKIDQSVTFDFDELSQDDMGALVSYQKTKADTAAVYLDRGVLSPEEIRQAIADDPDSGFTGIDPSEVPEQPDGGEEDMADVLLGGQEGGDFEKQDKLPYPEKGEVNRALLERPRGNAPDVDGVDGPGPFTSGAAHG